MSTKVSVVAMAVGVLGLAAAAGTSGARPARSTPTAEMTCIASKIYGREGASQRAGMFFASGSPGWVVRRLCRRAHAAGFRPRYVAGEKLRVCAARMKSHQKVKAGLYATVRSAIGPLRHLCPRWFPTTHWVRVR